MAFLQLNYNVAAHDKLEIIKGNDTVILLYKDGDTITKETHSMKVITKDDAKGFLTVGSMVEEVTVETASGNWDDRYTLEYSSVQTLNSEVGEDVPNP